MANRYSNIQPARYEARTLQDMMIAPQYMRQQHDLLDEGNSAIQTALAQVDPLAEHSEAAQAEQQKLQSQLEAQSSQLASSGFNAASKSDFYRLNNQYQQAVSPTGKLGKIQAAKAAMEANKASYIANATKQGFGAEQMAANWEDRRAEYIDEFNRTGEIKNIDENYAPKYVDYIAEGRSLFKDAGLDAHDVATGGGKIHKDEKGTYVVNYEHRDANSSNIANLEAAANWLNNRLVNPESDLHKSVLHERKSIEGVADELMGLGDVYKKTSSQTVRKSSIGSHRPLTEAGVMNTNAGHWEAEEAYKQSIKSGKYASKLRGIQNGLQVNRKTSIPVFTGYAAPPLQLPTQQASFKNSFSEEEYADYKNIYERFARDNTDLQGKALDSPEAIEAMAEYFEANQNIIRQDHIITDDFVTSYGASGVGTDGTTQKKMMESIEANPRERKYSIDGGPPLSYDEMPADFKLAMKERDLKFGGYYSPKNFKASELGADSHKQFWVSPLAVTWLDANGEAKRVAVSREQSEMESVSYYSDSVFNDVFSNTNELPDIPYDSESLKASVTYRPASGTRRAGYELRKVNPETGGYTAPLWVPENQLQSFIHRGFGSIKKPKKK